jgi:hypothetical protein
MGNGIQVTELEYRQLMEFIAAEIWDIRLRYNSLQATKDSWNDRLNPTSKTSGLSLAEIDELQAHMVERQHELFRQWYRMNQRLQAEGRAYYIPGKIAEIGRGVLRVTRYMDVIHAGRKEGEP